MPSQTNSSTLQDDTLALLEIIRAIDPNSVTPSSYLNSWDFTVAPCESTGSQFLGILCNLPLDNSSSRITEVDLDGIGCEGFLVLNLNNNNFRGPIPETIAKLRKLTRLTMSQNFFTGAIPQGITQLKNLQYIDVSGNRFSGLIPTDITGLRSLTYLSLSNNGFAGRIPNLKGLWQLNTLDLRVNQFYGDLPNLPVSLRNMYFHHNIPKGLIHLKWLDARDSRRSCAISGDVLSLRNVVHLNVSFNLFTVLEVINYSLLGPRLQVLEAQGNHLRGRLPVNLVTFVNLTTINLANNQFFGPIPLEYGTKVQKSWRRLYLDHNFLLGNLPSEISH